MKCPQHTVPVRRECVPCRPKLKPFVRDLRVQLEDLGLSSVGRKKTLCERLRIEVNKRAGDVVQTSTPRRELKESQRTRRRGRDDPDQGMTLRKRRRLETDRPREERAVLRGPTFIAAKDAAKLTRECGRLRIHRAAEANIPDFIAAIIDYFQGPSRPCSINVNPSTQLCFKNEADVPEGIDWVYMTSLAASAIKNKKHFQVFVASVTSENASVVVGFLIAHLDKITTDPTAASEIGLHVDLLCAKVPKQFKDCLVARSGGIGSKLLRAVEDYGKRTGVRWVVLFAVVTAEIFYLKQGYYYYNPDDNTPQCLPVRRRRCNKQNRFLTSTSEIPMIKCILP